MKGTEQNEKDTLKKQTSVETTMARPTADKVECQEWSKEQHKHLPLPLRHAFETKDDSDIYLQQHNNLKNGAPLVTTSHTFKQRSRSHISCGAETLSQVINRH